MRKCTVGIKTDKNIESCRSNRKGLNEVGGTALKTEIHKHKWSRLSTFSNIASPYAHIRPGSAPIPVLFELWLFSFSWVVIRLSLEGSQLRWDHLMRILSFISLFTLTLSVNLRSDAMNVWHRVNLANEDWGLGLHIKGRQAGSYS